MTTEPTMNRQTKSGVQYGVFGEGDQPTVVFVHGLAGDRDGLTATTTTEGWRADLVRQLMRTPRWVTASFARSLVTWERDRALNATSVPISLIPATLGAPPQEVPILVERCHIRDPIEGHHFHVLDRPVETGAAVTRALGESAGDAS